MVHQGKRPWSEVLDCTRGHFPLRHGEPLHQDRAAGGGPQQVLGHRHRLQPGEWRTVHIRHGERDKQISTSGSRFLEISLQLQSGLGTGGV